MKLNTTNFGEINIDESALINFEEGIPGFENVRRFALLQDDEMIVDWLQGIDEDIAFPVINPFAVKEDYEFKIPDADIKKLNIENQEDLLIYSIVVIPDDIKQIRTNLQAPIIINAKIKLGKQIILDDRYPLRYEFYEKVGV
ncbi:flagellar assembly factor FliW [Peptoclostridium acidaminophilum DSM 3953]|uniref:Flagellar assembly factor FliW n=1 Tax=Peptoclostridium acidaminophilum DSM 3953 TaxID=1286171 RepID=W8U3T3_PEPAC|nr:flagellar assembly protein FliW [Peptoclostridium acidaminophilum]AHM55621.1 flagellar assembly factor FliW [Peptoclostridium acidaminophilum DSM 3953]